MTVKVFPAITSIWAIVLGIFKRSSKRIRLSFKLLKRKVKDMRIYIISVVREHRWRRSSRKKRTQEKVYKVGYAKPIPSNKSGTHHQSLPEPNYPSFPPNYQHSQLKFISTYSLLGQFRAILQFLPEIASHPCSNTL